MVTIYTTRFKTETPTRSAHTLGVWLFLNTATVSIYSNQWLVFLTAMHRVWCEVTTEYLYKIDITFSLAICHNPPVGQGFLYQVPRSHTDALQSVGLLWTSDQPAADTSTWQHITLTTDTETSMLPALFEPATPASVWPQTHALDRAATGTG